MSTAELRAADRIQPHPLTKGIITMTKETGGSLEAALRQRLADPNATTGELSVLSDRLVLTFGDIGEHPRTVLEIKGGQVSLITPVYPASASAKRSRKRSKG